MNEDNTIYTFGDSGSNFEEPKKKNSNKGFWKKLLAVLLAAVVFGVAAGVSMFAVIKVTGAYDVYKSTRDENGKKDITEEKKSFEKELKLFGSDDGREENAKEEPEEEKPDLPPVKKTEVSENSAMANDVSGIVEELMPCVVAITGTSEYEVSSWFGETQKYEAESSGSGILVGEDDDEYMIATNNHVVADTKALKVIFINDMTAEAEIKGRDAARDIAVISVKKSDLDEETAEAIKIASIGDEEDIKVGQGVIAIGNALGYGQSVTVGYVSALNREITVDGTTYTGLIQTDAAINPGNSGGALINMRGEVIGINSSKLSSTAIEGVGYAIPFSKVTESIENFSNNEVRVEIDEEDQGYLGIQGQDIDQQTAEMYDVPVGVIVYNKVENSPAEDLYEMDIITAIDGQNISTMKELREYLSHHTGGETVVLTVQREIDGEYTEKTIEVTLISKKDLDKED